jgi:esterase/lipase
MYPKRDSSFTCGNSHSRIRVVIFHGYTGSTDEFEALAHEIAQALDAHVSVPLLPGHGTHEADLLPYTYENFIQFARSHVKKERAQADKLIIIGHSFGGYLAVECAAEFKADALVLTVVPFLLRFPLNLPGLAWLMRRKSFWDKKIPLQERIERMGLFYYRHMPGVALTLLNKGVRRARTLLSNVQCPILAINTTEDPLTYNSSAEEILTHSGKNPHNRAHIVERKEHGLFYGKGREEVIAEIVLFAHQMIT